MILSFLCFVVFIIHELGLGDKRNRKLVNNQRLWSVGHNDRRSKCFCSITVLCVSFTWQIIKTTHDQITSDGRSKCVWSYYEWWKVQMRVIKLCSVHSSGSLNECWLCTCHACIIRAWRLGCGLLLLPAINLTLIWPVTNIVIEIMKIWIFDILIEMWNEETNAK